MTRAQDPGTEPTLDAGSSPTTPAPLEGAPSHVPAEGADPFRPTVTADLEVGAEIARGGMGRVLRARDRRLRREVAVKELLSPGPAQAQRFEREVLITARLQHPAIVNLHAAGRWPDGRPFYEMKLVAGRPLDRVVAEAHTLAARLALLPSVHAVVEALAYAHGQRIVHRDLKPGNVLVGDFGETVVIDWGLAKDLTAAGPEPAPTSVQPSSGATETASGAVLGTPSYMPPEQAAGRAVGEPADVYALGAMLYHVLAGVPPYAATSGPDVIAAVLAGPPTPLALRAPDAPPELVAIVERAMAREPADRYPTAGELAEDLRRLRDGRLVGSHRYTPWDLARRWARRHRALLAAGAAALLAALAVGTVSVVQIVRQEARLRVAEHAKAAEAAALARRERDDRRTALEAFEAEAVRALADGEASKAAVYAAPVYAARPGDPGIRFLVARAMGTLDPRQRTFGPFQGGLSDAEYSPDGGRIVVAGGDRSARVLDARTGAVLLTLVGHTASVSSAAYDPAGARIVTSSLDGTARIWDAGNGALLRTFPAHGRAMRSAQFSPDGTHVAGGYEDMLRLWDASSGGALWTVPSTQPVLDAEFSPDGARIGAALGDWTSRIFDARTGAEVRRLEGHTDMVWSLAWSPDGSRVVTGSADQTARLWDARSGALLATLRGHDEIVGSVAFCGAKRVVTGGWDGTVRVWDARTGDALAVFEGPTDAITGVECTADGLHAISSSSDGTASIWDLPLAARLPVLQVGGGRIVGALFSPDGTRVLTEGRTATLWDVRTGARRSIMNGGPEIEGADFSRDGSRLVTAGDDGLARVWDARTGAELRTLRASANQAIAVAFSPDGTRVATAGWDGTVRAWDPTTGALLWTLRTAPDLPNSVAYGPGGHVLLTAGQRGLLRLVDASTGEVTRTIDLGGTVWFATFSPDGRSIAATTQDGHIDLFDATTGARGLSLEGHRGGVLAVAFSPDGALLLSAGADGTARVWSATTGEALDIIPAGQGDLDWAAFSPDGNLAVTAGADGTARLWDMHTESRSPQAIAALVSARAPYRLVGGRLVARDE